MSGGQDRKRIKAFGCSHTAQHHWLWLEQDKKRPGGWSQLQNEHALVQSFNDIEMVNEHTPCRWKSENIDMESWAISGSGIDSQIALWSMLRLNDNIRPSDTVIFQLTSPGRLTIPVNNMSVDYYGPHVKKYYDTNKLEEPGCFQHIKNDYFQEIDIFAFDPSCTTVHNVNELPISKQVYGMTGRGTKIDPWRVHMLMTSLLAIKSFNKKLLILIGYKRNWKLANDHLLYDNLLKAFDKFSIDYVEEAIVDYSVDNGYGIEPDGHATQKGYKHYTNEVLRKKLEKLGWL